ncbi:MAG: PBP1A family penicillin-binding protein, partial [Deltaproteobacteria bacterium]|nr:PBP1A family penicillin-binding protein [Deltaproteobacteria bacterium]
VSFAGGAVSELRGPSGELFASVETEAPKVTGFYGPKRQARDPLRLSDFPELLKDAVVLVEDRRFYEHSGLDPRGILRALWVDFRARGAVQGGSTITQQLAKNLFLNQKKTWRRKVFEAVYAMRFESLYAKDAILQAYLNEVYLGADRGLQIGGVAEGSRHYFGLDVRDLDLPKAALLAGLIRGPGTYDPFRKPAEARARRRLVLDLLLDSGRISTAQRDAADRAGLGIRKARAPIASGSSAYVDALRTQLADSYSPGTLETAGLRIYTLLDPKIQAAAQEALDTVLEEQEKARRLEAGTLQGAVIVMEPGKGAVRALVGGRGGVPGTFNRAIQAKRQPGSLMKPFAYAAALESRRFTPLSSLSDTPIELPGKDGPWRPANADGRYRGTVSLRRALEESLNVPSVRLLQAIGAKAAMDVAAKAGIRSPLTQDYSVVLGTSEVTPLEMATAFATFAAGGQRAEARFVQGVVSRSGEVLQQRGVRTTQALSPEVAFLVNELLRGTVRRGTGRALSGYGYRHPLSGKTGTTTGGRDAWFVGYTPKFLALIWVGPDEPEDLNLTGASAALPVWRRLVEALPGCLQAPEPEPPPGVVRVKIDAETGLLGSSACPQVYSEWFLSGTEPQEQCRHTPLWESILGGEGEGRPEEEAKPDPGLVGF